MNETGEESKVRFVGGCVRKALNGQRVDDIDLATSWKPDEVKQRLIKEGIKVIDTGLTHGTITAILNKKKFEITTLRKDILPDGRHSKIEFTLNWEDDASRRDFTINAIYSDIEGRIFDPFNGVSDLKKGIIKFIGSANQRIEEDCESTTGTIGQAIGADEGQCDEGSATRDLIALIQYPLLFAGIICGLVGAKVF